MTLHYLDEEAAPAAGGSTATQPADDGGWWPWLKHGAVHQAALLGTQAAAGLGTAAAAVPDAVRWLATTDPVSATAEKLNQWTGGDIPSLPTPTIKPGGLVPPIGPAVEQAINPVQPQGPIEEIEAAAARGAGGAALPIIGGRALSLAPGAAGIYGDVLAANPGRQMAAGGAVGATQGTFGALGADPATQLAAGLITGSASGVLPGATTGLASADRLAAGAAANARGWNIPPQKIVNSPLYQATAPIPFSGERAADAALYKKYAADAGKTMGATPDAEGRFSTTEMATARNSAGQMIGSFYENTPLPLDPTGPVASVMHRYQQNAALMGKDAADQINRVNSEIVRLSVNNGGIIPPKWLADQMRAKGVISQGAHTASEVQPFFSDLKAALETEFRNHASPAEINAFDQANDHYRNVSTAAKVADKNDGFLPPAQLDAAISGNKYQNAAYTGGGELGQIASLGKTFVTPPLPTWKQGVISGSVTGAHGLAGVAGVEAMGRLLENPTLGGMTTAAGTMVGLPVAGALAHRALLAQRGMPPTMGEYYAKVLMNPNVYQPPQFNQKPAGSP